MHRIQRHTKWKTHHNSGHSKSHSINLMTIYSHKPTIPENLVNILSGTPWDNIGLQASHQKVNISTISLPGLPIGQAGWWNGNLAVFRRLYTDDAENRYGMVHNSGFLLAQKKSCRRCMQQLRQNYSVKTFVRLSRVMLTLKLTQQNIGLNLTYRI